MLYVKRPPVIQTNHTNMKKLFNILTIAAAFTLTVPAFAKDAVKKEAAPVAKPAEKKEEAKKMDHLPLYGEVVSITDTLLTVKGGKDKPNREFVIDAETKITKDDKPATVKDATVGHWVGGSYKKGDKENTLLSLNLSAKQKDEKKAEEKKPATPETKKKVK